MMRNDPRGDGRNDGGMDRCIALTKQRSAATALRAVGGVESSLWRGVLPQGCGKRAYTDVFTASPRQRRVDDTERREDQPCKLAPSSITSFLIAPCSIGRSAWSAPRQLLAWLLLSLGGSGVAHADDAGLATLIYTRGPTATEGVNGTIRIVGIGSPLQAGDLISTGEESFAIIELADTTRVMLRPDTAVRLAALTAARATATTAAHGDGVSLQLDHGGLRAHGPKAAANAASTSTSSSATSTSTDATPIALQVVTADATVTSTGADFIARTCNVDCAAERASMRKVTTPSATSVARALVVSGAVSTTTAEGVSRSIAKGATMNVGDVISTTNNAHAVLAFRDGTRVTVEPNSAFKVEAYRLAPQQPETETAQFRLQRGGMRAATGDMGHRRLASMRFATPVATIGIRGTGFDLVETPECGGQAAKDKPALTASVWTGVIVLQESNTVINKGETVCQLSTGGKVYKADPPKLDTPRPDQVGIPQNTFDVLGASGDEAGTHVSTLDGDLTVSNSQGNVYLSSGEDGFANQLSNTSPSRTQNTLSLGRADPFLTLDLGGNANTFNTFEPVFSTQCSNGG